MVRSVQLGALGLGLAVGVLSLAVARRSPGYSFAGGSAIRAVAELAAGYAMLAVGVAALARLEVRVGALLIAASLAWFMEEWNNPGAGSAVVFTVGLVLYVGAPPVIAHAVLAYPRGRLSGWPHRGLVAAAYAAWIGVLGLLAAFAFDPVAAGCAQCPRNLLLVRNIAAYTDLNRTGVIFGFIVALVVALVAIVTLVRATPARRRAAGPVMVAGAAYFSLVAVEFAHSAARGFLDNDVVDRSLWLAQAGALSALALAVAFGWLRARRTRAHVARLVLDLVESPPAGGLREALAEQLGDETLALAYPVGGDRLVDARGRPARLGAETTPLVRSGREVAYLSHRPGLLDDPALVENVASAAQLALENERLQAEARAQLEELRASRARIIETGDAERRRLERDLHDGAQQRLVALALEIRLARSLGADADRAALGRVDEAENQLRLALDELREIARGIFPAVLAEEGLGAALEALEEEWPARLRLSSVPAERAAVEVEAAAYFVVAESLRCNPSARHDVAVMREGKHLVVEIEGEHVPHSLVELEDRVGALEGTVHVLPRQGGRVTVRAEIPCAS